MNRFVTAGVVAALTWLLPLIPAAAAEPQKDGASKASHEQVRHGLRTPPNVLMICIDDLNDWTGFLGGHPEVRTPHMDKLAASGRDEK